MHFHHNAQKSAVKANLKCGIFASFMHALKEQISLKFSFLYFLFFIQEGNKENHYTFFFCKIKYSKEKRLTYLILILYR